MDIRRSIEEDIQLTLMTAILCKFRIFFDIRLSYKNVVVLILEALRVDLTRKRRWLGALSGKAGSKLS